MPALRKRKKIDMAEPEDNGCSFLRSTATLQPPDMLR